MLDLSTKYMGLDLRSPLVVSANPLSEKIDNILAMEDAGAGAVVLF
jgi:dihydroorotate dehydrogenase (fumarate)